MNDYPSIPTLPTHNVARNNKTSNTEQFIEQVESKHKPRFMYNYDFLQQYCDDNNITLLEDYSKQKVNRRLYINARCLTEQCTEIVSKDFRNLTIHGCFCKKCLYLKNNKLLYNYNYLRQHCNDNNITLLEDYSKIDVSRDTTIKAKCLTDQCNEKVEKVFRFIAEDGRAGCFCKKCTEENRIQLLKTSDWNDSDRIRFSFKYLQQQCNDKNIKLLEDYSNIDVNRETIIKAECLTDQCNEKVEKTFRMLVEDDKVGCFCKKCTVRIGTNKRIITCINTYGVESPMQDADVADKASKHAYNYKDYIFPSGRVDMVQGTEPHALDYLLNVEEIHEDDIVTARSQVPECWWYDENGKEHRYYVDIYIISQQRCIEAKSTWTLEKKREQVFMKRDALVNEGYSCDIWVYNSKKEFVECL